jgi:hypothetical protein
MRVGTKLGTTLALVAVGLMVVPFPTPIAGGIKLKFIEGQSKTIPGIQVYERWDCYGFGKSGDSSQTSGPDGSVEFPGRAAYSGAAARFLGKAFTLIAVHASYGAHVSLEFQLPSGMKANFEDPRFKQLQPFNTSGSYLDTNGRIYFPQPRDNDIQTISIRGDFSQRNVYLEIPVCRNTVSASAPAPMSQELFALFERLVPASGQASTVQGELVRSVMKLANDLVSNGFANWDAGYERLWAFALHQLADGTFGPQTSTGVRTDIEQI